MQGTSGDRVWTFLRAHGAGLGIEALVNFILPFAIYEFTHSALGDFKALLCASAPPILWSLFEFLRSRRVDVLSLFVLTGILLSMLAYVGGGSVRLLQLRENLATAVIGLLFLGSAVIGRPLVYELTRAKLLRGAAADAEEFEAFSKDDESRRAMTVITLVCGVGLVVEAICASLLVFVMPIATYLLVGPVLAYGTMGVLCLWAYRYGSRQDEISPPAAAENDASAEADRPLGVISSTPNNSAGTTN